MTEMPESGRPPESAATAIPVFAAIRIALVYTYPGDAVAPEKEYAVGGFAAETVLERCSHRSLVQAAVEFEKLRYAFQMIIGRKKIGLEVDTALEQFFRVGKLDPGQCAEAARRSQVAADAAARRRASTAVSDSNIPDLDLEPEEVPELELELD